MIATFYDRLSAATHAGWTKIVNARRWLYNHSVGYLYPYTLLRGIVFVFALDAVVFVLLASIAESVGR